jgi:hypothetical protein
MPLDPCVLLTCRTHITQFIREAIVNGVQGWKASRRNELPTITFHLLFPEPVVGKVCSADPKES